MYIHIQYTVYYLKWNQCLCAMQTFCSFTNFTVHCTQPGIHAIVRALQDIAVETCNGINFWR